MKDIIRYIITAIKKLFSKKKEVEGVLCLPYKRVSNVENPFAMGDKKLVVDEFHRAMTSRIWINQSEIDFHTVIIGRSGTGRSYFSSDNLANVVFFKSNPSWEKLFQHLLSQSSVNYFELKKLSTIIKKHHNSLFRYEIYPSKYYEKEISFFSNEITLCHLDIQLKKIKKKMFGNQYEMMCSDELINILKLYIKENMNLQIIKDFIKQNIVLSKNSDELVKKLKIHINKLHDFSEEIIREKIKEFDCEIIHDKNEVLIIEVTNFLQMKDLGASTWCISKSEKDFLYHVGEDEFQFVVYDFNKMGVENDSILGYTMNIHDKRITYLFNAFNNKHAESEEYINIMKNSIK